MKTVTAFVASLFILPVTLAAQVTKDYAPFMGEWRMVGKPIHMRVFVQDDAVVAEGCILKEGYEPTSTSGKAEIFLENGVKHLHAPGLGAAAVENENFLRVGKNTLLTRTSSKEWPCDNPYHDILGSYTAVGMYTQGKLSPFTAYDVQMIVFRVADTVFAKECMAGGNLKPREHIERLTYKDKTYFSADRGKPYEVTPLDEDKTLTKGAVVYRPDDDLIWACPET
ncbi:hypothetical protein GS634_22010 [Ruegeria atlantica]|uniref:Uncharacterized protein n=1 Tax=Ruegeria atlantica TaxID=81569 RepID=A0AA91BQ93_9RHOB|nr:hypothetical protein [Ruegeria atlantica]NOE20815.1 hypothetical protein [Ruegeria atlantica]